MRQIFELDAKDCAKLDAFLKAHDKKCPFANPHRQGAIGGRLTYSFTPTSLGVVAKVQCACGQGDIDLSDYESW